MVVASQQWDILLPYPVKLVFNMYFCISIYVFVLDFLYFCYIHIVVLLYCCKSALREIAAISRLASHLQSLILLDTSQAHQCQWVFESLQRDISCWFWELRRSLSVRCQLVSWRTSDVLSPAVLICFVSTQYNIYVRSQQFTLQHRAKRNTIQFTMLPAQLC